VEQAGWRDGRLRFDRQPLSAVVSALDRYSRKRLILWNDRAGRQIVSGVVNAHQADREITALAQSQGLSTTDLGFAIILR
jgi:transmembrane sensor